MRLIYVQLKELVIFKKRLYNKKAMLLKQTIKPVQTPDTCQLSMTLKK